MLKLLGRNVFCSRIKHMRIMRRGDRTEQHWFRKLYHLWGRDLHIVSWDDDLLKLLSRVISDSFGVDRLLGMPGK